MPRPTIIEHIVIQLNMDGDDPSIHKLRNPVMAHDHKSAAEKFIEMEGDETISEYDILAVLAKNGEKVTHFKPVPPKQGWTVEVI